MQPSALARAVGSARTPDEVLAATVRMARDVLGADCTFAAVADGQGAFPMRHTDGIRDPRFLGIRVRPGLGLGGQVLVQHAPLVVTEYADDTTITRDFVHVVAEVEGLHAMICVPIAAGGDTTALLYTAAHSHGPPGDRAVDALSLVASTAQVALDSLAAQRHQVELARLRERQQLATELHDSVAQMLFAIGVAAHYSRQEHDPDALARVLHEIEVTAASARRELRDALQHLARSPDGVALEARLAGEVRLAERLTGCRVTVSRRGDPRQLPEPVETLVVDTVLEGVRNATKHGGATVAVAHLRYEERVVTMTLQTDQQVVAEPAWPAAGSGAGLAMLRSRAEQLRGTLEVVENPGEGSILRLELPVHPPILPWTAGPPPP